MFLRRNSKLPIFLLITTCAYLYLGGCSVAQKFRVSLPQNPPSNVQCVVYDDVIRLRVQDLNLSIQSQNYKDAGFIRLGPLFPWPFIPLFWTEGEIHGPLEIWLAVWLENEELQEDKITLSFLRSLKQNAPLSGDVSKGSDVPGSETISFNPERVILKTEVGTRLKPTAFSGPGKPGGAVRLGLGGLGCGAPWEFYGFASRKPLPRQDISKRTEGPMPLIGPSCFYFWFDTNPDPENGFALSIEGISRGSRQVFVPEIEFRKGSVWKYDVAP